MTNALNQPLTRRVRPGRTDRLAIAAKPPQRVKGEDGNLTNAGLVQADQDVDGDIDGNDYALFQGCYNGPNLPPKATCTTPGADLDGDTDVHGRYRYGVLRRRR